MAKVKANAVMFPVPQSKEEVVAAIARLGEHQRERVRIETEMNDEMAIVRQKYETQAETHAEALRQLTAGIQTWCEANRKDLTQDGKTKTVAMQTGEVKWRFCPSAVNLKGTDLIIETLKKLGLSRFIRTKEEINRDAMLADPKAVAGIKGVSIKQKEEFIIIPFETKLEEIA